MWRFPQSIWPTSKSCWQAAKRGRTSEVQDILDHGVNFNSAGENGQTALNAASYQGHLDVVRLLLTKGADVSAGAQKDGWTPLWSAVSNGHYEVARALIYHGANTETQFHDDTLLDRYEGREGTERIVTLLRYAQARPAAATDPLRAFPIDEDLAERARTGDRSAQQSVGHAHWQRGNAYLEQGSYDLAIESFAEALRINPQFAPACVNMGLASAALDDFASAIEAYDRALQIDPHLAPAYNNRGTAYRDQGNLQAAIESYSSAIRIEPAAHVFCNRGIAYDQQGNFQMALADFNAALALAPSDAQTYYERGVAYAGKENYASARKDWEQAAVLDPSGTSGRKAAHNLRTLRYKGR